MKFATACKATRGPFLVLAPVCVALGAAAATLEGAPVEPLLLALIGLGALSAHISVNMRNEYEDFASGLDMLTVRTPFSGGSGALPAHPEAAAWVRAGGTAALVVTCLTGMYFVWMRGWPVLLSGIAGIVLITTYTRWLNRWPLACLLAPGAGFGLLMTGGTAYVLSGEYSLTTLLVSLLPFCLANNLLLLNQFPDLEADRAVGRRHFAIAWGTPAACGAYGVFLLGAGLSIVTLVLSAQAPGVAAIALLALLPGVFALGGAWQHQHALGKYPRYLAANVLTMLLTPSLLAASVFWSVAP